MSLILNVDHEPHQAIVARKLLETCQELNLCTVAEGIETEGDWDWVRRHGVNSVQGNYFARPSPVTSGVSVTPAGPRRNAP